MAINLITWAGQTVTPKYDAIIQDACAGRSGILYGCNVAAGGNALTVYPGYGVIKGRLFEVTQTAVTVTLPSSGTQAGTLIIRLDLANTAEPIEIAVETGVYTPEQDEDANFDSGVYEMVLATFSIVSSGISDLEIAESRVPYNRTPVYQSLADLGLSAATLKTTIFNSMTDNSVAFLSASDITDLPYTNASGIVAIFRGDSGYGKMLFLSEYGKANYQYSMNSSGSWRGSWDKLPTQKDIIDAVADINSTIAGHVNKLFYVDGETAELRVCTGGVLTNGKTEIYYSVPLSKSPANCRSITLFGGDAKARQNGKYLIGSGSLPAPIYTLGLTCTLFLRNNCIEVHVRNQSGFDGINNDSVHIDGSLTVVFHA